MYLLNFYNLLFVENARPSSELPFEYRNPLVEHLCLTVEGVDGLNGCALKKAAFAINGRNMKIIFMFDDV